MDGKHVRTSVHARAKVCTLFRARTDTNTYVQSTWARVDSSPGAVVTRAFLVTLLTDVPTDSAHQASLTENSENTCST
eukprot:229477-Chlamydomonas_euryale.AAC.6